MFFGTLPVVSAEQKTPSGEPPHYAEDEGLYVGERPKVNWTNQVVVENRLLKRRDKVREIMRGGADGGREGERIKPTGQTIIALSFPTLSGSWLVW